MYIFQNSHRTCLCVFGNWVRSARCSFRLHKRLTQQSFVAHLLGRRRLNDHLGSSLWWLQYIIQWQHNIFLSTTTLHTKTVVECNFFNYRAYTTVMSPLCGLPGWGNNPVPTSWTDYIPFQIGRQNNTTEGFVDGSDEPISISSSVHFPLASYSFWPFLCLKQSLSGFLYVVWYNALDTPDGAAPVHHHFPSSSELIYSWRQTDLSTATS